MKKLNITKSLFALLAFAAVFTACKKDWEGQELEAAQLGFVHASPGTGTLDFIVNNQKVNSFTFTQDYGYYAAYPGSILVGVAKKDSLKYLVSGTAGLSSGKAYSFFVIDTLKSTTILQVEDDLTAPQTDKAKVRFINLSPRSTALDLSIQGVATPIGTGKAFKEFSAFTNIAPSDSYTFEVKDAGSATVKASLPNVKIEKGKIYTIWAKGLATATDSTKFALAIMNNN